MKRLRLNVESFRLTMSTRGLHGLRMRHDHLSLDVRTFYCNLSRRMYRLSVVVEAYD